ncbi:MAG: anti-sigma factor [Pseudotabrizicola sp.]|uniref:anti-sigma factor n=1 Tax=Pseudotabrizicola sp. TaxID=2939647 RepID=UPI00271AC73D|nr:anti-sigma factor [Pseudotabrizicola sp.]MDO8882325.1 anti-sigma factor [Pseudotabrizicola sp.]MDP2083203.1 anti-sigma factor [Pseudotabrizicola sp.]MDZ7572620.1 anti-sigma factor [Pseudotabrizicola sp.]
MTDAPLTPREEDDALAAEYVLGVLALDERLAVEQRLKSDSDFALLVARWVAHFAPLNEAYATVPVPPDLLPKIESRLFPKTAKLRFGWRTWLAGAVTAAAIVVGALVLMPPTAPGTIIASLGTDSSSLIYEARHDGSNLLVTRVAGTPAPDGQTHELWVIAPGAAPVSLGLLGVDPLDVEYPRPPAGWVLAVSVEPAGGSPTGAPTGPVILTAEL